MRQGRWRQRAARAFVQQIVDRVTHHAPVSSSGLPGLEQATFDPELDRADRHTEQLGGFTGDPMVCSLPSRVVNGKRRGVLEESTSGLPLPFCLCSGPPVPERAPQRASAGTGALQGVCFSLNLQNREGGRCWKTRVH